MKEQYLFPSSPEKPTYGEYTRGTILLHYGRFIADEALLDTTHV